MSEARNDAGQHTHTCCEQMDWAARYYTGLLIRLTLKGVLFSFLF
jgi:hypothetical protein